MADNRMIGKTKGVFFPICNKCIHYLKDAKCSAFKKGIPDDILEGSFIHTKKHTNQTNTVLFEEI